MSASQPHEPVPGDAVADEEVAVEVGKVLSALAARADDRADRESYQQIRGSQSLTSALRMADLLMTGIALDLSKVLREDYGLALDAEAWQMLLGLPAARRAAERRIEAEHGYAQSVDRAFAELAQQVRDGAARRAAT